VQHQASAGRVEQAADRSANAACASGDQYDFVIHARE
jgi:hypothetical protein